MRIITDHPIALDSIDHLVPLGTKNDNNSSLWLLGEMGQVIPEPYSMLDIGCAGGQWVADCLSRGNIAVGLEGSDYSLVNGRANWPFLFDSSLFLCDVRYPFWIDSKYMPTKFDVITAWEVLEHFSPTELYGVIDNIANHLKPGGMVLASISRSLDPHHASAHLPWSEWQKRLGRKFHVHEYPFVYSPRPDTNKTSQFVMLTRKT